MLMTALSVRLPQLVTPHQQTSWCQTLLCSDPCYWLPASLSEPLLWVTCSESQCSDLSPVCVSSRRWGASSSQRGSERIDSVRQRWLHCSRTGRGEEGEWNASVYLHTPERGARAGPGRAGSGRADGNTAALMCWLWADLFYFCCFTSILFCRLKSVVCFWFSVQSDNSRDCKNNQLSIIFLINQLIVGSVNTETEKQKEMSQWISKYAPTMNVGSH